MIKTSAKDLMGKLCYRAFQSNSRRDQFIYPLMRIVGFMDKSPKRDKTGHQQMLYGRQQVLLKPVKGEGQAWVDLSRVIFNREEVRKKILDCGTQ